VAGEIRPGSLKGEKRKKINKNKNNKGWLEKRKGRDVGRGDTHALSLLLSTPLPLT
jgi:hypothetical protein